jgi:N-acetylmuramoyl-L-alanine amidase
VKGYVLDPKDLYYTVEGAKSGSADTAYLWACQPAGMRAINGVVYGAQAGRPALLVSPEGKAVIRWDPTDAEVRNARLTIGAELIPLAEGRVAAPTHGGPTTARILIGTTSDGKLIHFYLAKATLRGAGLVAKALGCTDAIQLQEGAQTQTTVALGAVRATPLPAKTFVLDPGHGGEDPGAHGNGLTERDLNLSEAYLLWNALGAYDVLVLPTRRTNEETVPLADRSALANAAGADLFLSMHHNAAGGRGYEDFVYLKPTTGCLKYQSAIQKAIAPILAEFGVPNRGAKKADYHVVRETVCPSVLVEWLFVDQADDAAVIKNPTATARYVSALLTATVDTLGLEKRKPVLTEPPPSKLYRVQVGAFADKANADGLVERLKAAGFDAYVIG